MKKIKKKKNTQIKKRTRKKEKKKRVSVRKRKKVSRKIQKKKTSRKRRSLKKQPKKVLKKKKEKKSKLKKKPRRNVFVHKPKKKVKKTKKEFTDRIKKIIKKADARTSERTLELTPMRIYLNQIEHIPLLTPDKEQRLAKAIKERKKKWRHARKEMIHSNLRLVINIAKRYMNIGLPFSDIVEEGNIGLMRAVDKFNYKKGYRFSTYASWWIKQSIMRALSNQGKLIRIPVHMYESISRWKKVSDYLKQKHGRYPTQKEIAKVMKVSLDKVKEIETASATYPSSLNVSVNVEGDAELMDLIEDDSHKMPHEETHITLKRERIETLLNYINEREKKILILRFGLFNQDTHTLEETAKQFGITRERVRQIEEVALKKIRNELALQNDTLSNYL